MEGIGQLEIHESMSYWTNIIEHLWCGKERPFDNRSHYAMYLVAVISFNPIVATCQLWEEHLKTSLPCSRQGSMAAKISYHFLLIKVSEKPLHFILLFNTSMNRMALFSNVVFIPSSYLITCTFLLYSFCINKYMLMNEGLTLTIA